MHVSQTLLARGPIAYVERADGDRIHLHVGPVSVRLSLSAAASLSRTLAEAIAILELEPTPERSKDPCRSRTISRRSFGAPS